MLNELPRIDERTEKEIAKQIQELIKTYVPVWNEIDLKTGQPASVSAALINIFARYGSLIIQRLNRAPEKNLLAFLDLLGATLLPPEPARVPVTFSLTPGSVADAVVPPGTQVAAPPAEGEKDPVIYETEQELVVTAVQLASLFVLDPSKDHYADQSALLAAPTTLDAPVFAGVRPIDHILYIASDLFGLPVLDRLTLIMDLASGFDNKPDLLWEFWNGSDWAVRMPSTDETDSFTRIDQGLNIEFTPKEGEKLEVIPLSIVNSMSGHWIRCRLMTPIAPPNQSGLDTVDANHLPEINSLSVTVQASSSSLTPASAFNNQTPVDLSKDFFPFGEKPKFGDTFYIASDEAFSQVGTVVTLNLTLNVPAEIGTNDPATNASPKLQLTWEVWTGTEWKQIGTSSKDSLGTANGDTNFKDETQAFTLHQKDKVYKVSFKLPTQLEPTIINGITNCWIRVWLSSGNYGEEAKYIEDTTAPAGFRFVPATFAPPSIKKITLDHSVDKSASQANIIVLTYNDFKYDDQNGSFAPFQPVQDTNPSLYLGFTPPPNRAFPNRVLSLFFQLKDILSDQSPDNPSPLLPPRLIWEYWNGSNWAKLVIKDETITLTHPGLVQLLPPADFSSSTEFGLDRYWLRVRWETGDYKFLPRLRTILLNTTTATQGVAIKNEVLGSSNGGQNQIFRTTRIPILKEQQLQVREPELPSAEEQAKIEEEEGHDVLSVVDTAGRPKEIWVRWHAVPDFYGSGPHDRHYVIDHLNGEIRFGDGVSGRIPPLGSGNIRMSLYKSGGGSRGNRVAGAIVQLKTTVPYVNKVINYAEASGGSEAETLDSLIQRGPRSIRHRDRAVTIEDYEDLAMLSTPEVARAKCIPLYDLLADPDATRQLPGVVSVIIVPRSTSPRPLPSIELIERVQTYIDAHRIPTADLIVVGPDYVRVDIEVEIALTSLNAASDVGLAVNAVLTSFLHPLTGGLEALGWDFGRQPYESDLYALLEAIPGVDHVRTLNKSLVPDRLNGEKTNRFLVYAGTITFNLMIEEP